MEIVLLGSILALRIVQGITGKSCSRLMPSDKNGLMGYFSLRMGLSASSALALLLITNNAISGFSTMPLLGWTISAITGLTLTISSICGSLAMRGASVALCSLFSSAGLLVPTIAGIYLFDQSVGIGQWAGIAGLLVAAVLLASSSKRSNGKLSFKTGLLLMGSMLGNGGTMLLQTLFQSYVPQGNVSTYSFLQFLIPALILFAVCVMGTTKEKAALPRISRKLFLFSLAASLAVLFISQISTIASRTIPVAILFPISNGGGTVISAVIAAVMFKERITWKSGIGIGIGVASLIAIKLFAL